MRWALTGTPGTGKTTVARRLDLPVVHLNERIEDPRFQQGRDEARGSTIADLEALSEWLLEQPEDLLVESHLAHLLPVDRVVVLRCHPDELASRLRQPDRAHTNDPSIEENVEAERLDLILAEAIECHGPDRVFEIDTTDRSVEAVSDAVEAVLAGERTADPGRISFLTEP